MGTASPGSPSIKLAIVFLEIEIITLILAHGVRQLPGHRRQDKRKVRQEHLPFTQHRAAFRDRLQEPVAIEFGNAVEQIADRFFDLLVAMLLHQRPQPGPHLVAKNQSP